jgi:hypothetical protein
MGILAEIEILVCNPSASADGNEAILFLIFHCSPIYGTDKSMTHEL